MIDRPSIDAFADLAGDHIGYWASGHWSDRKMRGACINAYRHDFDADLAEFWKSRIRRWWCCEVPTEPNAEGYDFDPKWVEVPGGTPGAWPITTLVADPKHTGVFA